jgi:hypothetical protein
LLSTAFAGLAAGALWCLLALGYPGASGALIVPLGGAIGLYLRWMGAYGGRGAACALAATLIAFVYAQYLFAAVRVADMLGFPLRNTLFRMDWGLAWQAACVNFRMLDLVALFAAIALACWIAARQ